MSMPMAQPDIDLSTCDNEPIHAPGAIQPHAYFCAFLPDTNIICAASGNLAARLDLDVQELVGQSADAVFDDASASKITSLASWLDTVAPFEVEVSGGERYWANPYWTEGVLAIDFEPIGSQDSVNAAVLRATTEMARLRSIDSIDVLIQEFARSVRNVLGFDRTMVYQFDQEYNGTVRAEFSSRPLGQSYLGLQFPHTDIPKQARALFARNRVRSILSVTPERSEIYPQNNPLTGEVFDLSDSTIRSVSPLHIEYLQNMNVQTSLSISLLSGQELWGLIACHQHGSEIYIPPPVKAVCTVMCEAFSQRLSEIEAQHRATSMTGKLRDINNLYTNEREAKSLDFGEFLATVEDDVLALIEADGVYLQIQGFCVKFGALPPDDDLEKIYTAASDAAKRNLQRIFTTDNLETLGAASSDNCAGVLFHRLPGGEDSMLAVRKEQAQPIKWAGDPGEKAISDPQTHRLHPRRSFEIFQEMQRGRSAPWPIHVMDIAPDLAGTLSDIAMIIIRRAEQKEFEGKLEALVDELSASNTELERFAYVASHDLSEPLRMVRSFSKLIADRYEESLDETGREYIRFSTDAAQRMQALIDDLLTYARLGQEGEQIGTVDTEELFGHVKQNLADAISESAAVVTHEPLPTVMGNGVRLTRLLQNLVGNAIKYQAPGAAPEVRVKAELNDNEWEFSVEDNGIGIAEAYRRQIFLPFRRLHGKQAYSGTGIGLAICKKIVEGHGGRIWAEPASGKGSVFRFTIPERQEGGNSERSYDDEERAAGGNSAG